MCTNNFHVISYARLTIMSGSKGYMNGIKPMSFIHENYYYIWFRRKYKFEPIFLHMYMYLY